MPTAIVRVFKAPVGEVDPVRVTLAADTAPNLEAIQRLGLDITFETLAMGNCHVTISDATGDYLSRIGDPRKREALIEGLVRTFSEPDYNRWRAAEDAAEARAAQLLD